MGLSPGAKTYQDQKMQDQTHQQEAAMHGNVERFKDNAEGTVSFKQFSQQIGRCGERIAGETGKSIYLGEMATIDESFTDEDVSKIYEDLITAKTKDGRVDHDAYYYDYAETDSDGITPWRWTDATVRMLNVKIRKMITDAWHLILDKTHGADAWDIVELTESSGPKRLTKAWDELRTTYDDYAPHEKRTAKTRMQSLLAFKVKKSSSDPEGTDKFRTYRTGDDVTKFFTGIKRLKEHCLRVHGIDNGSIETLDSCKNETIIANVIEILETRGYATAISEWKLDQKLVQKAEEPFNDWKSFKDKMIEHSKKLANKKIADQAQKSDNSNNGATTLASSAYSMTESEVENAPSSRLKHIPCRDYAQGNCTYGDECKFGHFGRGGGGGRGKGKGGRGKGRGGRYGGRGGGNKTPQKLTSDGHIKCHHYEQNQRCSFGSKCIFAHVKNGRTINNPTVKPSRKRKEHEGGGDGGNESKKQALLTMVAQQYPEMDLEDFDSKLTEVMCPGIDVQLNSNSDSTRNPIWNDGLVWGIDSNASYGLTCFDKFLINKRKGPKRIVQGMGGTTLKLSWVYDAVIYVRANDGREIIILMPVYYHPECDANVFSAVALSKSGYHLSMDHANRYGLSSNTNSGDALIGPDNTIVWLNLSGRSDAGIVTIRAADRAPDPSFLPFDIKERAQQKLVTYKMTQKQLRQQRAAALIAQRQMASTTADVQESDDEEMPNLRSGSESSDSDDCEDTEYQQQTKGKRKRVAFKKKHQDFRAAGAH